MSERDSDFRIKPGRIRSTRAPRTKSYVNQVLAAAQRAGHMPSGALAGKAGRRLGHSTFGRGRNVFGRSRIFSPQRRVVVKARIARHQGKAYAFTELTVANSPIGHVNAHLLEPNDWRVVPTRWPSAPPLGAETYEGGRP